MQISEDRFLITYRISAPDRSGAEAVARDITYEQTVETPPDCVPESHHVKGVVGRVESLLEAEDVAGAWDAVISFHKDVAGKTLPQFLNVAFGNISLKNNIVVRDIDPGTCGGDLFPGPSLGVYGLREKLGVFGRPLACTALKPLGVSATELAGLASAFARGGVDLIKDDHGLSDQPFHPFRERVALCQEAVCEANARTGRKTLYCPMISGRFDEIERQVRFALSCGIEAVLVAPMLIGLDAVRHIASTFRIGLLAHPAFTGTHFHARSHGMAPAAMLGTLFRLIGADVSIFPNAGGRFSFTPDECVQLAQALRRPMPGWAPAFPAPAGGMRLERIEEMYCMYGDETVFLIGGDLLRRPENIQTATNRFMDSIRAQSRERLAAPADASGPGACELPAGAVGVRKTGKLCCSGYRWSDRAVDRYKDDGVVDFAGITRQNLIGMYGEGLSFDLRYFEIAPGGFSSLERHEHQHVIIGARGAGILIAGDRRIELAPHDIGCVYPYEGHQLRNESKEPFGFYCIVDHSRDRPVRIAAAGREHGGGQTGKER